MKPEIEVKFLGVDIDDVRARLQNVGAVCEHSMRLLRRVTIDTPDMKARNAYLRIRDEGNKITATYKQFDSLSVDGAKEIEIEVSSFDDTIALLAAAGLTHNSFQESKRETWHVDGAEVVIDVWPWLNPYIEIEGDSERLLQKIATRLGFNWSEAVFGDVMVAYRAQYPHLQPTDSIGDLPEARFNMPLPPLLTNK